MKQAILRLAVILAIGLFLTTVSSAHTPLCSCSDEGDGTILCEGGFSDGSSAAGVKMTVVDESGNILVEGEMDEDSEFTFEKPDVPYTVIFDAGPGHMVKVPSSEITE